MSYKINLVILFFSASFVAFGQSEQGQLVSFSYENQSLGYILSDINQNYGVRFSYSSNVIAVKRRLSIRVQEVPMNKALDQLCDKAELKRAKIGDQLVLKAAPRKVPVQKPRKIEKITKIKHPELPKYIEQQTPLYQEPVEEELAENITLAYTNVDPIQSKEIKSLPGGDRVVEMETKRFKTLANTDLSKASKPDDYNRLAQISILPRVGTNASKSEDIINNVSVNLFWGSNGGVDGLEVGGIFNSIQQDMKGVQVAGVGNHVNENVVGTQVGGIFNVARGKAEGVQASGIFNYAKKATAIQAAGIFNIADDCFSGLQVAPIMNSAGPGMGVQVSGLMNINHGGIKTQVSGLMNIAGDVDYAQISPIMNIAKKVKGFQFGLINVADTVSGVPIGLLNLVRKGYNRVEIFAGESLVANAGLKLGARSFYNIFQIGARWDNEITTDLNGNENKENVLTWGFGYGFGTAFKLNKKSLLNIELVGMHINEREEWTDELNLLGQLRFLVDMRLGRRTSIFVGPTGNIMLSNRFDADSNTYGSNIMSYSLYDETIDGTNTKMWIGFNGGFRF